MAVAIIIPILASSQVEYTQEVQLKDTFVSAVEPMVFTSGTISQKTNVLGSLDKIVPEMCVGHRDPNLCLSIFNKIHLLSVQYKLNEAQFLATIRCESNFYHYELYGDSGLAYGVAQFHYPTFAGNCVEPNCDYKDVDDQLETMALMWSEGKQKHWTCFTKLYGQAYKSGMQTMR